jgi:hypothetical protein
MSSKIGMFTVDQLEEVIERVGGYERAKRLINHELKVVDIVLPWKEENDIIYLPPLTSDGTTGPEWIKILREKNRWIDNKELIKLFLSDGFKPTTGVTYNVAIIKGKLFLDNDRTTEGVYVNADNHGFKELSPEVACLICESLSKEEFQILERMGISNIVIMHSPFIKIISDREIETRFSVSCMFGFVSAIESDPKFGNGRWNEINSFAYNNPAKHVNG